MHDPGELSPAEMTELLMFIQNDMVFYIQPSASVLLWFYSLTLVIQAHFASEVIGRIE